MQQQQNSQSNGDQDGDNQQLGDSVSPITRTAIAFWLFVFGAVALWVVIHDHVPDTTKSFEVFIASMFSLALVIVVIIQAGIYFRQAKALDAQQKIMSDSLRIGMQAYVCVHSIELDLVKDRIFVEIENLGKVPADSIEVSVWLKLELPPKLGRKDAAYQNAYGWGRKTELYPGNLRITIRIPLNLWLGAEDVGLIKSGDGKLIAEGVITFYDRFLPREPKVTHFAFVYRLTEQKWFPQRILSPEELEKQNAEEGGEQKAN